MSALNVKHSRTSEDFYDDTRPSGRGGFARPLQSCAAVVANPAQRHQGQQEGDNPDQRQASSSVSALEAGEGALSARARRAIAWMSGLGLGLSVSAGRLAIDGDHARLPPAIRARVAELEAAIVMALLDVDRPLHSRVARDGDSEMARERDLDARKCIAAEVTKNAPAAISESPRGYPEKPCSVCGDRHASFGFAFDYRNPEAAEWFCRDHKPA